MSVTLDSLLKSMSERLFTQKEPYLTHLLRKILGRLSRKYLRENLTDEDVIIYTDYSKGLYSIILYCLIIFTPSLYRIGAYSP